MIDSVFVAYVCASAVAFFGSIVAHVITVKVVKIEGWHVERNRYMRSVARHGGMRAFHLTLIPVSLIFVVGWLLQPEKYIALFTAFGAAIILNADAIHDAKMLQIYQKKWAGEER